MDKRIALLLICFLFGCTSTVGGANTNPTPSSTFTSTRTPLPSFTPTITPTFTLTPTPTPAFIAFENVYRLSPIKTVTGESLNIGKSFNKVSFSPDFNNYTTVYDDKTIILWNAITGQKINTISTNNPIRDVEFSPDGKIIAIDSQGVISLWDSATGEQIHTAPCFGGEAGMVFSLDSKAIFNGGSICDIETGQTLVEFDSKFYSNCWVSALSSDGKMAACTSDDRFRVGDHQIILANVSTGESVKTLNAEDAYPFGLEYFIIRSLAFSPDGRTLASIDNRNKIILWDVNTGTLLSSFDPISQETGLRFDEENQRVGFSGDDVLIAFSPDGKILAAGYAFGSIIFWDIATAEPVHIIRADVPSEILYLWDYSKAIDSLVFSADGKMLAAADGNNIATIWGLSSDILISTPSPTLDSSTSLAILDVSGSIAAQDASLRSYKADTFELSINNGTYTVELNTNDNTNICFLSWRLYPITDTTNILDAGDSNRPDTFTIYSPGKYVIYINETRTICQAFSYTLKVTQP